MSASLTSVHPSQMSTNGGATLPKRKVKFRHTLSLIHTDTHVHCAPRLCEFRQTVFGCVRLFWWKWGGVGGIVALQCIVTFRFRVRSTSQTECGRREGQLKLLSEAGSFFWNRTTASALLEVRALMNVFKDGGASDALRAWFWSSYWDPGPLQSADISLTASVGSVYMKFHWLLWEVGSWLCAS